MFERADPVAAAAAVARVGGHALPNLLLLYALRYVAARLIAWLARLVGLSLKARASCGRVTAVYRHSAGLTKGSR